MKVSKWGNSLAIRLPVELAEKLGVREGDEIEHRSTAEGHILFERKRTRAEMWKRIEKYRGLMPDDFKFDREEANKRGD